MKNVIPEVDSKSMDIVADNISKLKELFPEIFTEGKVDFDALKEVLGGYIDGREERYSFTWNGKSKARMLAQTPSTGTLRPCKEESVDWDTTQNLFIEGDNLEVLKLLQKSYHKKVKMIYIDPPYNTGKDFVYKDNFKDNIKNYKEITGQVDGEGRNLSNNPETNGRYHTDWLNMIYPRLKLARNLLKDNGIIFISIDDGEVSNLRKICDEIFGEENFIANFLWEKRITRENRKIVSNRHDHVLCYCRNASLSERVIGLLPMDDEAISRYKNPDNDPRGVWTSVPAIAQAGHGTKNQFYTLTTPSGREVDPPSGSCWRYTYQKMQEAISDNRIWFGSDGDGVPRIKKFLNEGQQGLTIESMWWAKNVGNNDSAKRELTKLFDGKAVFDTPKPSSLINQMLQVSTDERSIVLDFFSGTAPTAQAVMQLNVKDRGQRKFVMIQLPELTSDDSEAFKAGYKTIAEIGKERIRRAAAKIKEENPDYKGDLGFKVFKLDSTNIKPWEMDFDLTEQDLEDQISNIKHGREEEDVLFEVLLKYGLDLTLPITEHSVAGHKVFDIGMGALMICLSDDITLDVVEGIAKLKDELNPEIMRVVFKDAGFADDVVKTNAVQILKQAGIEDVRSL
ncbi:TPA: site-specific DNA-methyltransferase [Klebsiella pneumoniae]|uniref:site-specific DNA-methyltransferase n=1 Tax=Klebsiella quasipneumoniae TaxID=1463165 RepID=UPI000949A82F|nr:site-specific DNA-methyltransferase [Klebsiella quasipneumoniae]HDZ0770229.1 site-specific DNA-methyltransferase [Klebsiella pneumoniae]HEE5173438.1 site-specific DNA-methyltransferase [Klebsiella pneumoniae]